MAADASSTAMILNMRNKTIPCVLMMTSSNGNIFQVIGPLLGDSTGHWWIPLTKASDTEF